MIGRKYKFYDLSMIIIMSVILNVLFVLFVFFVFFDFAELSQTLRVSRKSSASRIPGKVRVLNEGLKS
jgi:uncharacterized membrane protein